MKFHLILNPSVTDMVVVCFYEQVCQNWVMCVEYSQATMQFSSSHVSCIVCLEYVYINNSIQDVSH